MSETTIFGLLTAIAATIIFFVINCPACGLTVWFVIAYLFIAIVEWKERK